MQPSDRGRPAGAGNADASEIANNLRSLLDRLNPAGPDAARVVGAPTDVARRGSQLREEPVASSATTADRQVIAALSKLEVTIGRLVDRLENAPAPPAVATHAATEYETPGSPPAWPLQPSTIPDYLDLDLFEDPLDDLRHAAEVAQSVAPERQPECAPRRAPKTRPAARQSGVLAALQSAGSRLSATSPKTLAIVALVMMLPANVSLMTGLFAASTQDSASSGVETASSPDLLLPGPIATGSITPKDAETPPAAVENEAFSAVQTPSSEPAAPQATPAAASPESQAPSRLSLLQSADVPIATADEAAPPATIELPPANVGPLSLRRAAAQGDASAQFEVGARLAEGKGTSQDFGSAVQWYQRSAARGFAQAQYRLGTHYERGLGVTKDLARARVWYQRAAEQGNVKAMHNLAVLCSQPNGSGEDYSAAVRWFTAGANHNLPDSQFNLAVLHENGLGVPRDKTAAYKWYAVAARNGDKEAARRRDTIGATLAPADRTVVDAEVRDFQGEPASPLANDPRAAGEDWKKRQATL